MASVIQKGIFELFTNESGTESLGCFSSVSGLEVSIGVETIFNSRINAEINVIGKVSFKPIILKKGVASPQNVNTLYEWIRKISYDHENGSFKRSATPNIDTKDDNFKKLYLRIYSSGARDSSFKHIEIVDCWISNYRIDDLIGGDSEVLIEEATITNNGWRFID